MNEVWKDIPGYEGKYQASSEGRIKSLRRGIILKPWPLRNGYLQVGLGKYAVDTVHRLVLLAFVGPCPPGMECRHFPDRSPTNNRPSNLSWGTRIENAADRFVQGTQRGLFLTMNGETLCLAEWSRRTGLPENTIRNRKRRGWDDERTLTEPVHWNPFKGPRGRADTVSDGLFGSP